VERLLFLRRRITRKIGNVNPIILSRTGLKNTMLTLNSLMAPEAIVEKWMLSVLIRVVKRKKHEKPQPRKNVWERNLKRFLSFSSILKISSGEYS